MPLVEATLIEVKINRKDVMTVAGSAKDAVRKIFDEFSRKNRRCGEDHVPTIVLNIAGPRQTEGASEEDTFGIYEDTKKLLVKILEDEGRDFIVSQADRAMVIEQALESLRHWDTMRWLSPFFFFTLAGGAIFGLSSLAGDSVFKLSDFSFQIICGALITAGYLSLLLINKTVSYHKNQVRILACLGVDRRALPMVGFNWWRTATTQFRAVIFLTMVAIAIALISGRSKTFEYLGIVLVTTDNISPKIGESTNFH